MWLVQKMYILMCYTPDHECVQQVLRLDPQNKAALLGDIANNERTISNATRGSTDPKRAIQERMTNPRI